MMIRILLLFFFLFAKVAFPQTRSFDLGVGSGVGSKLSYGDWGLYLDYAPAFLDERMEFVIGAGFKNDYAYGGGVKVKVWQIKKFATLVGSEYSYHTSGILRLEKEDGHTDYYSVSDAQFLSLYLTERFYFNNYAAVLMSGGYSRNISGYSFQHTAGPRENDGRVKKNLDSGFVFEIGVVIFFKQMANKPDK